MERTKAAPKKLGLVRKIPATPVIEDGYPVGFLPPGGHITNPPVDCLHRKKVFLFKKIECLDFGICQSCCKEKNKCRRRKEWMSNKYGEYHHLLFNWKKLHPGK